jgi:hypothetical protein
MVTLWLSKKFKYAVGNPKIKKDKTTEKRERFGKP